MIARVGPDQVLIVENVADLPKIILRKLAFQTRDKVVEIAVVGAFAIASLDRSVADGIKPLAEDRCVRDGVERLKARRRIDLRNRFDRVVRTAACHVAGQREDRWRERVELLGVRVNRGDEEREVVLREKFVFAIEKKTEAFLLRDAGVNSRKLNPSSA